MSAGPRIVVARVRGAHGLKGEVAVRPFTADPADVAAYGELAAGDSGRMLRVVFVRSRGEDAILRIEGIADRTAAEALRGLELWVPRAQLPAAPAEEYYHADLVGLACETPAGRRIGHVVAVQNFGAGDLLEIAVQGARTTEFVPFDRRFVPTVDMAGQRVVVDIPETAADPEDQDGG